MSKIHLPQKVLFKHICLHLWLVYGWVACKVDHNFIFVQHVKFANDFIIYCIMKFIECSKAGKVRSPFQRKQWRAQVALVAHGRPTAEIPQNSHPARQCWHTPIISGLSSHCVLHTLWFLGPSLSLFLRFSWALRWGDLMEISNLDSLYI